MKLKRVVVTGATGFIGQHLVERLVAAGVEVVALVRAQKAGLWEHTLLWDTSMVAPDLSEFGEVDAIFHLAGKAHALSSGWQDEQEYFPVNIAGTRCLLEAAREARVQRFVFFSSVKATGEPVDRIVDETDQSLPESMYGRSKRMAEQLVLEGDYVPEPVILRLSMVYGPTQMGNLARMIEALRKGRFPPLPETDNKRSMVHVDDVVQAAILAAEKMEAVGQTYIVSDGIPYSTCQIYAWICEALEKPVPSWHVPIGVLKTLAKVGDGIGVLRGRRLMFDSDALDKLLGSAYYDSGKIERELGYKSSRNLQSALTEIVEYLSKKDIA